MSPWTHLDTINGALEVLELLDERNEALEALEARNRDLDRLKPRNGALEPRGNPKWTIFVSLNSVPKWTPTDIPKAHRKESQNRPQKKTP